MAITTSTRLYAVLGNPVRHSLGPLMHNAAFAATGFDGVYTAFEVEDIANAVAGIRALGIAGASVTLPHKVSVMPRLDSLDPTAEAIGAVNTIVNTGGCLTGFNTDAAGAVAALGGKGAISGRRVAVIGAGGAARAVAFGVADAGGQVALFNRSADKAVALAAEVGGEGYGLESLDDRSAHILINTTPVGMAPNGDTAPALPIWMEAGTVVMDIIYTPLETRLLREARQRGCRTLNGIPMFVHQGAAQFAMWTGFEAPSIVMQETVVRALSGR
jgi:shikimate dehydrogenase